MCVSLCNKSVRVSQKDGEKSYDDRLVKKAQQKGNIPTE